MFCRCLKFIKQRGSRYISWNILLLWGFGLWIALCASNMYHSDNYSQPEAALFYLQNPTSGITYNVSIKSETVEELLCVATTNYVFCNLIRMSKAALRCIHAFMATFFLVLFVCSHEYLRKVIKIWNNTLSNSCTVVLYLKTLAANYIKKDIFDTKINENDYIISESKLVANSKVNTKRLQTKLNRDDKVDELALQRNEITNTPNADINVVRNEIIFSSYTLLLFSNYELYRCFDNRILKNHLSSKCLSNLNTLNNFKRDDHLSSKKVIKKGIVSSSPEFKKFLANLRKSQLLYPCMLEVSTSCIIRIKSTYG